MKTDQEIYSKITEHQTLIDEMLAREQERDDCFWFNLLKLRSGQKALEWVLCSDNYLKGQSELDKILEFEYMNMVASKIF